MLQISRRFNISNICKIFGKYLKLKKICYRFLIESDFQTSGKITAEKMLSSFFSRLRNNRKLSIDATESGYPGDECIVGIENPVSKVRTASANPKKRTRRLKENDRGGLIDAVTQWTGVHFLRRASLISIAITDYRFYEEKREVCCILLCITY